MQQVDDNMIFGLDIGTRSIVGILGYEREGRFEVIAAHTEPHQTRSMIDGQIHDIDQVAHSIQVVKENLESKINGTLKKVCIAAAGRVLKTLDISHSLDIDTTTEIDETFVQSIELQAMDKAMRTMNQQQEGQERPFYCVGYTVTHYYLNDLVMSNLVGHQGTKVGVDLITTFLPVEVVNSLYKVVQSAGLDVYSLTLEPIAAIEVAIPDSFRLLNIALVDIGAGTSDIAITREGSIVAYGMIPYAGDELTETLVHKYLVDFAGAEAIKVKASRGIKKITFKDAMGLKQTVESTDVLNALMPSKEKLATLISEKIKELNGGNSTNAVFIVGGGGQVKGFDRLLAQKLELPDQRVALRGKDVLQNVEIHDQEFKKNSEGVTPIGICLTGLKNNEKDFIDVYLNDEIIRIFNTHHLTVMDVVALKGIDPSTFVPHRGEDLTYTLNDKEYTLKGDIGESASIFINDQEASLSDSIDEHDYVTIIPAKMGKPARARLSDILGKQFYIMLNGERRIWEWDILVNNIPKGPSYILQNEDKISPRYPSLEEVLNKFSVDDYSEVFINENPCQRQDDVHPEDKINTFLEENLDFKEGSLYEEDPLYEDESLDLENHSKTQSDVLPEEKLDTDQAKDKVMEEEKPLFHPIHIFVNDQPLLLEGKEIYIFVDIFDYIDFDRTRPRGTLITTKNGNSVSYMEEINEGDYIQIYWKE